MCVCSAGQGRAWAETEKGKKETQKVHLLCSESGFSSSDLAKRTLGVCDRVFQDPKPTVLEPGGLFLQSLLRKVRTYLHSRSQTLRD